MPRAARHQAPVQTTRATNPDVWKEALQLAGGNAKRLIVEGYNTILVVNRPVR